MTKYRFCNKYQCVYYYSEDHEAYMYLGSYATFGLTNDLTAQVASDIIDYKLAHLGQEVRL